MNVSDLVEARDAVENVALLSSISDAQREQLSTASEIIEGLIPCEDCSGRGWSVVKAKKNKMVMVLKCDRCNQFEDHRAAGRAAYPILRDFTFGVEGTVE